MRAHVPPQHTHTQLRVTHTPGKGGDEVRSTVGITEMERVLYCLSTC